MSNDEKHFAARDVIVRFEARRLKHRIKALREQHGAMAPSDYVRLLGETLADASSFADQVDLSLDSAYTDLIQVRAAVERAFQMAVENADGQLVESVMVRSNYIGTASCAPNQFDPAMFERLKEIQLHEISKKETAHENLMEMD